MNSHRNKVFQYSDSFSLKTPVPSCLCVRFFLGILGGGGSRTPVLMREIQASTDLAAYWVVGAGLAKRRAARPYSGLSYQAVSGSGNLASPDCDAEAVPQSGGTVPRNYAAKA